MYIIENFSQSVGIYSVVLLVLKWPLFRSAGIHRDTLIDIIISIYMGHFTDICLYVTFWL